MEQKSSIKGSLTEGYLWTFGSTALPLISAFVVSLIVARWMGPRVVGLINWTMAVATILLIPAKFGIEGAASRLVSEYAVRAPRRIRTLVSTSMLMRAAFTIPVGVAAAVFAPQLAAFFNEQALVPLFRISSVMILTVSFNELAVLLILGLKKFRFLFVMRFLMFVIRTGLVILAIRFAFGPVGILGAYIAATFVPAVIIYFLLLRGKYEGAGTLELPGAGEPPSVWRRLLKLSVPLAISGASVTIYSLLDKLMLGYFEGATQVGIYSMARNLLETSLFPTFALVMTLRPALAGAWAAGDSRRCRDLINRSVVNSIFYSSCVVVVFACLARPLIVGLFSLEFDASARILVLFMPLVVMRSIGAVILPGLIAADRAGTYAKLTLIGAATNFVLNAVLIPLWGAEGAVISTLLSYLPIEILGLRALVQAIPGFWRKRDWLRSVRTITGAAVIITLYHWLAPDPSGLPATLAHAVVLTVIFAAMLLVSRTLTPGELKDLAGPLLRGRGRERR